MLTHTPSRRGSAHIVLPAALIAAAIVLFLASSYGIKPTLPLQLGAAALLTTAIQLIGRFSLTAITYTITEFDDNPPDCIIITRTRGRAVTREYLPLSAVSAILPPDAEIDREIKARHNFCVSLLGAKPYAVLFEDPSTAARSAALLECSPAFAAAIEERITPVTPSL